MNRRDFLKMLGIGTTSVFVFGSGVWLPQQESIVTIARTLAVGSGSIESPEWLHGLRVGGWIHVHLPTVKDRGGFYKVTALSETTVTVEDNGYPLPGPGRFTIDGKLAVVAP